ncbi:MAG TPA: protein-glutamate O-methyltransferase CheR [Oxalicibacterium sp.]|nr:protein-glutamate O-methyltransferase CheR [Oxalicibacterium sp.]
MICPSLANEEVDRFRDIIERRLGLYFDEGKRDFLAGLLHARLEKRAQSCDVYLRTVEETSSYAEWRALGQLLTVPETYFFRHFEQFRAFTDVVLPERLAARTASGQLAILSLGCASGEEAYSLAVMVREANVSASWNIEITAADINAAMLEKAAAGRYTEWALRETPAELRRKWFQRQGREYVLDTSIRQAVHFEERNLAASASDFWRSEAYDVIFCRNMMMYFSPEQARALIEHIAHSLAPGGYLFLGHAETLRGLSHDFQLCHSHETFYYRRRAGDETTSEYYLPATASSALPLSVGAIPRSAVAWMDAIQRSSERIQQLMPVSAQTADVAAEKMRWNLDGMLDLLRQERFAEALDAMGRLPSEAEADADTLLLKAVLFAHSGQLESAEKVCRSLLELDDLHAGAWYVLALCCEGAGDNEAAIEHNKTASYLDPGFAMPHLHLGLLLRRGREVEIARQELERASDLLQREDASRLLLFGGGFGREALLRLCHAELLACGGRQ